MRRVAALSMQGPLAPRPPLRALAAATAVAVAGGAVGWSLALQQQRLQASTIQAPVRDTTPAPAPAPAPEPDAEAVPASAAEEPAATATPPAAIDTPPQKEETKKAAPARYTTPLHEAAVANNEQAVLELLAAAADKRAAAVAQDENGNTPLFLAALHGKEKAARALLFAAPEAVEVGSGEHGLTPLMAGERKGPALGWGYSTGQPLCN